MRRRGMSIAVLAALWPLASPAVGQEPPYAPQPSTTANGPPSTGSYGPGDDPSTPSSAPSNDCAASGRAVLSESEIRPGEKLSVSGPPGGFKPGTAGVGLVRAGEQATTLPRTATEVGTDGSVRATITIPKATTSGVYVAFIDGTDPAGQPKVLLAPLVITGSGAGSADSGPPVAVPACAGALKPSFSPGTDAGLARDVAAGKARVVIDGSKLNVVRTDEEDDSASPVLWALGGGAVIVLGGAALAIRRRRRLSDGPSE